MMGKRVVGAASVAFLSVYVAFWATVLYVAAHFLQKVW